MSSNSQKRKGMACSRGQTQDGNTLLRVQVWWRARRQKAPTGRKIKCSARSLSLAQVERVFTADTTDGSIFCTTV
ncbi:hypothetical protein XENORESO_002516 [Xenotaenia resolanae]|uniref:Uncharacterized protein n=1 Tax=Xenotaenia resolanae TaxID=208358 RepID=A0ABV0X7T1_9TELE